MEERDREDPSVRVSQGERGAVTPRQPRGSPFPVWTEGGLGSSGLPYRGSPASQLGLLLGADSRAETPHSLFMRQSAPLSPQPITRGRGGLR